jgi:hypothetical protein
MGFSARMGENGPEGLWAAAKGLPPRHRFFLCVATPMMWPISTIDSDALKAGLLVFLLFVGLVLLFKGDGLYLIREIRNHKAKEKSRKEALASQFNCCSMLQGSLL